MLWERGNCRSDGRMPSNPVPLILSSRQGSLPSLFRDDNFQYVPNGLRTVLTAALKGRNRAHTSHTPIEWRRATPQSVRLPLTVSSVMRASDSDRLISHHVIVATNCFAGGIYSDGESFAFELIGIH